MTTKIDEVLNDLKQQLLDDDALYVKVVAEDEPVDLMSGDEMFTISIAALKGHPSESIGTFRAGEDKFLVYPFEVTKDTPSLTESSISGLEVTDKITPAYRFDEGEILNEIRTYIDSTYTKHYATNSGFQATDAVIATGHGVGYCVGNILKYAWRLGKKEGFNNIDIMKVIHYSIILLFIMKKEKEAK